MNDIRMSTRVSVTICHLSCASRKVTDNSMSLILFLTGSMCSSDTAVVQVNHFRMSLLVQEQNRHRS